METQKVVEVAVEGALPRQNLKAERVQDSRNAGAPPPAGGGFALALEPGNVQQRLKAERVQQALKALPGWRLHAGGKAINRARLFPTPELAERYSSFVACYAGVLGLPVLMSVSGGQVVVMLYAPRSRGRAGLLTEAVLEFARRLG
jgi:hypothetical protein